ncbi:hypothetical protein B4Q13_24470, partial [Lacticaseibacillus rhamnosus]
LAILEIGTLGEAAHAIKSMQVRGAPLIGAMAAYGVCLALREDASDEALDKAIDRLAEQRPTAVNLRWALEEMRAAVRNLPREARVAAASTSGTRSLTTLPATSRASASAAARPSRSG